MAIWRKLANVNVTKMSSCGKKQKKKQKKTNNQQQQQQQQKARPEISQGNWFYNIKAPEKLRKIKACVRYFLSNFYFFTK